VEFTTRQVQRLIIQKGAPGRDVEGEGAEGQTIEAAALAAPHESAHTGIEFAQFEWLGQVVIGAEIEATDAVVDLGTGRDNQNRCRTFAVAEFAQQFQPVHMW